MKKLTIGLATAGVLLTAAAPAMAQVGFYVGPAGVGVGVGEPYGYYGRPYGYGYYDYYGGPWHRHWHHHHDWRR